MKNNHEELGIKDVEIVFNEDISKKLFKNQLLLNNDQQRIVEKYLKRIGQAILESTKRTENGDYKDRWSEKRVEEAALGYNDAQQIIIFNDNIPTYSLTPLWANGKPRGHEWEGLFQRTDKD